MPSARRWSVSDGRTLTSVLLLTAGVFLVCASIGSASWPVAAVGVAVLAAAIAFYVVSALNSREFSYVPGSAHVVSCSPPPASAAQGRCELHLVVHAPGMDDVAVKIRDTGVPVSKWPDAGATLPILVAVGDPRRVRVMWDRIRSHAELAQARDTDEDYRAEEYPEDVDQETYLEDILDEDYDAESPLVQLDDDSRVIELDVGDPTLFRNEPAYDEFGPDSAYDPGPGLSRDIQLDPDTALATDTRLTPGVNLAGPDSDPDEVYHAEDRPAGRGNHSRAEPSPADDDRVQPGEVELDEVARHGVARHGVELDEVAQDEVEPPPPPSPRRRPSPRSAHRPAPRTRPALDDPGPLPDLTDAASGSVTTLSPQSGPVVEHEAWKPPPPVPSPEPADERPTGVPALRVRHLLAPDPAVPAIPASPSAEDADVSDVYLSATPPEPRPGALGRGRSIGVTLFVANLGRSVAFYRDVLGFRQVDMGLGSAVLEAGDGRIVLRRVVDMAPVDRRLVHLFLEVPDVQAAYDELLLQGVEFVHRPRPVSHYEQLELWSAAFRDPDGHGIALTKWDIRRQD